MPRRIITLTTDFGLRDPYVAEMKAVILSICPDAVIVDITHEVEKFNVRMGAWILASAAPFFPSGTVHVAVVDPSVGSGRRAILVEAEKDCFVGPDNGLLALAAKKTQRPLHVYEIVNRKLMMPRVSATFHGRDVFAPAAAHLATGTALKDFGPEIDDMMTPAYAKTIVNGRGLVGEVMHVDGFGNIVTSFAEDELRALKVKEKIEAELGGRRVRLRFCRSYQEVGKNQPLALIGSHGFLEIAVNQGNASKKFKAKTGNKIAIYKP